MLLASKSTEKYQKCLIGHLGHVEREMTTSCHMVPHGEQLLTPTIHIIPTLNFLLNCNYIDVSDINDCDTESCYNGGTCEDLVNGYQCKCEDGFKGNDIKLSHDSTQ